MANQPPPKPRVRVHRAFVLFWCIEEISTTPERMVPTDNRGHYPVFRTLWTTSAQAAWDLYEHRALVLRPLGV